MYQFLASVVEAAPIEKLPGESSGLSIIIDNIGRVVNVLVPVLMVIATIVFIWGIIQYVLAGADETKKGAAKSIIIYGLVGLFVIVAVWGIVRILVLFFGVESFGIPVQPGSGAGG